MNPNKQLGADQANAVSEIDRAPLNSLLSVVSEMPWAGRTIAWCRPSQYNNREFRRVPYAFILPEDPEDDKAPYVAIFPSTGDVIVLRVPEKATPRRAFLEAVRPDISWLVSVGNSEEVAHQRLIEKLTRLSDGEAITNTGEAATTEAVAEHVQRALSVLAMEVKAAREAAARTAEETRRDTERRTEDLARQQAAEAEQRAATDKSILRIVQAAQHILRIWSGSQE